MKNVDVYDVTLRDGTQGEGVSFSVEDKIRVAHKIDELGVKYIGGWIYWISNLIEMNSF